MNSFHSKLILFVLLSFLLSCSNDNSSINPINSSINPINNEKLANTKWIFLAFETVGVSIESVPADVEYRIFFSDSTFGGKTDSMCINSYGGIYFYSDPNFINIPYVISTRALCRESYWKYLDGLKNTATFQIHGEKLFLYSKDKKNILHFRKLEL